MATEKTYSVAGVTIQPDGIMKVRWTNNIMRIKILHREGHTDIRLADLGREMTKYESIKAIQSLDEFQDAAAQSCIADYLEEKAPAAARPAVSSAPVADIAETSAATEQA
jgi:hypothetical protein